MGLICFCGEGPVFDFQRWPRPLLLKGSVRVNAEKTIWEPWLSSQDGFLGRQIFWDKEKEVALILVNWKNKKLWKSISMKEVN